LGRGGYRVGFGPCPHPLPVSWTQHQVVLACVLHPVVKRCYPDAWLWHPPRDRPHPCTNLGPDGLGQGKRAC